MSDVDGVAQRIDQRKVLKRLGHAAAEAKTRKMAKITPMQFYQQVRQEVSKVTWPSRKETTITSAMVFVMVIVVSLCLC